MSTSNAGSGRPTTPWQEIGEEVMPRKADGTTGVTSMRPEDLAKNLKHARKVAGLTREALAARANLRISSIESYESGKFWPPVVHAQMLADALGTRIPVLLGLETANAEPVDEPAGLTPEALAMVTKTAEEVQTLRRSLEVARASEHRWMNLAEAAAEGIMLHDGERVIDVNPKFARLFGYDRKEVLGRPLLEFVAPESHAAVIEHIQSGSTEKYELFGLAQDGSTMRVLVRARTLPNGQRVVMFKVPRSQPR